MESREALEPYTSPVSVGGIKDSLCIYWHLFAPLGTSWDSYTAKPVGSPDEKKKKSESKSTQSCIFSIPSAHLFIDLISIQRFPVRIPAGVKRADKLIVVNEAIIVDVKDARHCVHLQ